MANLSPLDFFPRAKADELARKARRAQGGTVRALSGALGDFVSMVTSVPAVSAPVIPAIAPNRQPVPDNLKAALPGTLPAFYYGPPPPGFLPEAASVPNVDGAVFGCCPTTASMMPADNQPAIFGNAVTTVAALSNTLAPFVPEQTAMSAPAQVFSADLAIAGQIQAAQGKPNIPVMSFGPAAASPGAMSIAMPKSIAGAFNLLTTRQVALEPDLTTSEIASFRETSFTPGTGQGANAVADGSKAAGLLAGLGDDDAGTGLPGWGVALGLIGLGLWALRK